MSRIYPTINCIVQQVGIEFCEYNIVAQKIYRFRQRIGRFLSAKKLKILDIMTQLYL